MFLIITKAVLLTGGCWRYDFEMFNALRFGFTIEDKSSVLPPFAVFFNACNKPRLFLAVQQLTMANLEHQ